MGGSIGDRIRLERTTAGLTQEQLGIAVGVTAEAVSLWESGKRRLAADKVPSIARALGITVARLYNEISLSA